MIHFFDADIAKQYGVNAAVLLYHIAYWIKHNEANGTNYYDGNFWTYNSMRAFGELFPYMSERQISTALSKLIDDGVIVTGNYNKSTYDRTLWYALTQKGKCIMQKCKMDTAEMSNGLCGNVEPIPDNIPNNKPDNKHNTNISPENVQEIFDMYHEICVSLPKVRIPTDKRKSTVKARLKKYGKEQIREAFEKAERSKFLTGQVKDFKASFDWILNETNLAKIIEGNYDDKSSEGRESGDWDYEERDGVCYGRDGSIYI